MLCERCQKQEATIHLTQTRQGKTTAHHLCDACARELGIGHHVSDYFGTIGNLIGSGLLGGSLGGGSVFNVTGGIPAFGPSVNQNPTCQVCGQSFDDFRRTGLFGCSHCYEAFAEQLDPVFRRVQGGTHHIGHKTGVTPAQNKTALMHARIQDLKKALQLAVAEEAYEQAARIRDEIKAAEKALAEHDKNEGGEKK